MIPIEDLAAAIAEATADDLPDVLRGLLVSVQRDLPPALSGLLSKLHAGHIASEAAADDGFTALSDAHARAAYLGRNLAGSTEPFGDYDTAFGQLIAEEQAQYFEKFVEDVSSGRYTGEDGELDIDAIERRAELYERRLRGSANEAWANTLPDGELIVWETHASETCATCETLANDSPWQPLELPTYPGSGETDCSIGCKCSIKTESGQEGF
jgi:hypothetical protein